MADSSNAWRLVGAAVAGSAHLRLGIPCQDALAYRQLDGILLAALSDGAGSAAHSAVGARLAVETALECLVMTQEADPTRELDRWELRLCCAFEAARLAVLELAETEQEPVREYAATLTCLVATTHELAIGTLGDCVVIAGNEQGELFAANTLQRGEYANETNFLTQDDALSQVQVTLVEQSEAPITQLALLSDGLSRLALSLPANAPYQPFFQPLFKFAAGLELAEEGAQPEATEQLAAFLASERVCARTDDDKTLLLAVREAQLPKPTITSDHVPETGDRASSVDVYEMPETIAPQAEILEGSEAEGP